MDVVRAFRERYERERPFAGKRLLVCMHCEPKAAVRTEALLAGGAEGIVFVGKLGSTKPDTAAYLASLPEVTVLARQNDTLEDLQRSVADAMAEPFDLLMDNGAALMQQFWRSADAGVRSEPLRRRAPAGLYSTVRGYARRSLCW